jgi:hypothetical protein
MRHSALYYLSGLVAGIAFTVTMFMLIPSAIEDGPKPPAPLKSLLSGHSYLTLT